MKFKIAFTLLGLVFAFNVASAQDCRVTLSLFNESAKVKNFSDAYPKYKDLLKNCSDYHILIYKRGEKMLEGMIDVAETEERKQELIQEFINNQMMRLENFPNDTKEGAMLADVAMIKYKHEIGTLEERLKAFEDVAEADKDNFSSPVAIYAYFRTANDLNDTGERDIQFLFDKYDEVIELIEIQENDKAAEAQPLIEKKQSQQELTSRESRILKNSEIYLRNYTKIKGSVNSLLGSKADCDNLIPLYNKEFDEKKSDVSWLRNANARLSAKDCTEDPLFFKVSEALHKKEPSANSAYSLGQLAEAEGNRAKALEYFNEAAELETSKSKKSRIYYRIANNYKDRGNYSQARSYYRRALDSKPSLGIAYLKIADMYAKSANDCGKTVFEKRAVYWLAADYATRAGIVDPSISSNADATAESYKARAPQKSDIFQEEAAGRKISFSNCWIRESVVVPNI
ncbi:tetratricopeptide repeat protein [Psychroflexus sp. CAK57W]|uniref:tetratricopeptide repeat protein n=1 Tax=Psychroflexus curvus TaxID=2873595 RepID=UPI001CC98A73|nr:tetratricopeptide repeat protein [Psychroflexus curvus]MBZ9628764.1 tetratricopeptide repeat protein [Psychroflexus curvus]MBZ9786848.1 tetratricopeptide repeat protein [Psychroflexus curvus]